MNEIKYQSYNFHVIKKIVLVNIIKPELNTMTHKQEQKHPVSDTLPITFYIFYLLKSTHNRETSIIRE